MSTYDRQAAFAQLRQALQARPAPAAGGSRLASGCAEFDRMLHGGLPLGAITSLEGRPGTGRSLLLAAFLRSATQSGFAALIEFPGSDEGRITPAALAASGIHLSRLLLLQPQDALGGMRAAEFLTRSNALRLLALPSVPLAPRLWHRLARVAEKHHTAIIAIGSGCAGVHAAAALQLHFQLSRILWTGTRGPLGGFAGADILIDIRKARNGIGLQSFTLTAAPFAHRLPLDPQTRHHCFRQDVRRNADFMHAYADG